MIRLRIAKRSILSLKFLLTPSIIAVIDPIAPRKIKSVQASFSGLSKPKKFIYLYLKIKEIAKNNKPVIKVPW